jgi:ADP-dependent NAD(P)H-hydrate dehydratase
MTRVHELPPLPPRPLDGHKGLFGRVLVVGGNNAMLGAPVLAGTTALRCGSGLVQIALPRAVLASALSITPELIGLALTATNDRELVNAAEQADVIVLGPGIGQSADAKRRVLRLIKLDKPMVIDADALNILSLQKRWPASSFKAKAILTPHPGEMKRLGKLIGRSDVPTDDDGRIGLAAKAAKAFGSVVVLKGHRTVVSDGDQVYVNHTGDSTLSKAGAGDVLSGLTGSILGQQESVDRFAAARIAVHVHGRAGEIAGRRLGRRCALARDVIEAMPESIAEYERENG